MEKTFVFIKPDCVAKNVCGAIISRYEGAGLRVCAMKKLWLTKKQAETFYGVHRERGFFGELVAFMTEGPVVAMVLEGENAVTRVRDLNGATNPANAAPGTIRKDFADGIERNAVHSSDSADNAKVEMSFLFNGLEML